MFGFKIIVSRLQSGTISSLAYDMIYEPPSAIAVILKDWVPFTILNYSNTSTLKLYVSSWKDKIKLED